MRKHPGLKKRYSFAALPFRRMSVEKAKNKWKDKSGRKAQKKAAAEARVRATDASPRIRSRQPVQVGRSLLRHPGIANREGATRLSAAHLLHCHERGGGEERAT